MALWFLLNSCDSVDRASIMSLAYYMCITRQMIIVFGMSLSEEYVRVEKSACTVVFTKKLAYMVHKPRILTIIMFHLSLSVVGVPS